VGTDYELLPENGDDETEWSEGIGQSAEAQVDHGLSPDHVAEIYAFMRKASSPAVGLYPKAVEEYVMLHAHEISNEERWRAGLAEQMGNVASQIRTLVKLGKTGNGEDAAPESMPTTNGEHRGRAPSTTGAMNDTTNQVERSLRAMEERMAKNEELLQTLLLELRQLKGDRAQPADRRAAPAASGTPAVFDA